jgi:hypothetical protein
MAIRANADLDGERLGLAFSLRNTKGLNLITFTTYEAGRRLSPMPRGSVLRMGFEFDNILVRGEYGLVLAVEEVVGEQRRYLDYVENAMTFHVSADQHAFSVVLPPVHHEVVEVLASECAEA